MINVFSIRYRFIAVLAGIVALTAISLSIAFTQAIAQGSDRISDDVLHRVADDFSERLAIDHNAAPPSAPSIKAWRVDDPALPEAARSRMDSRQGKTFSLQIGERHYRGMAFAHDQRRWLILSDITQRMEVRRAVRYFMLAVSIAVTLLAIGAGFWLSNVVLNPINRMLRSTLGSSETDRLVLAPARYQKNEIGELSRALDDYAARLHGFVTREQAFAADISHELRTPLSVMLNACEILSADPELPSAMHDRLRRMERSAAEMSEMVNALLALSREPRSAGERVPVQLDGIIHRSIETYRQQIDEKPLTVDIRPGQGMIVATNEALLFATVSNLIRNAFAYTEKGTVLIEITGRKLVVSNPSTGIRPASSLAGTDGTPDGAHLRSNGIGLSLVRRICQHQGWQLDIASDETTGSTVSIEFPA